MKYREAYKSILSECDKALSNIDESIVNDFINLITSSEKVFFVGVGRVLLSLQSIAKRFAHLGIDCYIVGQITEPAITDKDVLIVASGSGESLFPVSISKKAKQIGAKVIHIGSNPKSSITPNTDLFVRIPVQTKFYFEDEIKSKQPMTSLFEQSLLLFGDTVASILIEEKELDLKSLWKHHANLE